VSHAEGISTDQPEIEATLRGRGGGHWAVDVRSVLFTVAEGRLLIALEQDDETMRLPRGGPTPQESLDTAARRIIRDTTGLQEHYLEQLYTLSEREEDRWEIIISYLALVGSEQAPAPLQGTDWYDVGELPALAGADALIVDYALVRLRAKLGYTNVAFALLPETFTLSELQGAYETILNRRLDKRNFRRRVIAAGILTHTDAKRRDGSHRPAALYRFRAEPDPASYLTPPWADDV
jgi:8-oxo-dGTP diphosphatase